MPHPCNCQSTYQDARYGPGIRYHNIMVSKVATVTKLRCTVCGHEVEIGTPKKKDEK